MLYLHTEHFFDRCFNGLYPWVTEFDYLSGIRADHMIMLLGAVRFFELCNILPELMLTHQIAGEKEFDRVVQGCS